MIWHFFPITLTKLLTASADDVNEGGTSFFTLSTKGVAAGTQYSYAIKGVSDSDLSSGALAGTATVGADGKAIIAVSLANDTRTEGDETMTLEIAGQSAAVTVKDTSLSPVVPSSFTLTTGSNTFTGTAGADTFDAGLSTGSLQTLNSGDRLDGGAGTDELLAVVNGSVTPAQLANIENVTVTVVTNSATVDFTNASGLTSVSSAGSSGAGNTVTLAGLSKAVGVFVKDTSMAHTITYNDVSGSADAATVNVSNVSQGTGVVTSILGVETLTLNATGNASSSATTGIGTLTATQTTKLVVTGDKALNIVDNLGTSIITVDASASTGNVNLDFGAGALTVTGGTGNDDFSFKASGNVNVNGGAGNDTFRFDNTGTLTTADTVEGGADTDTLRARSEELDDFTAAPTTYRITDVERITADTAVLTGATINVSFISTTADRLTLTAANAGAATFNFNAGASTLVNTAATGGAITVDAAGTATTDSLTISHGGASAVNSLNGQALTSTDFETVTINTTGTGVAGGQTVGAVSVTPSTGGTAALVITGSNSLTTGVITATSGSIDASGMTVVVGTGGLDMVTGANSANTITGSAGDDDLWGSIGTTRSQTISGGAGNDTITAGSGNDSLSGGADSDTIDGGAGNDNIDGGAGNDRVLLTTDGDLTSADTISGGADTDTLVLAHVATLNTAAEFVGVSGFEIFEFASAGTETLAMSDFISNQTFTRIDFGQGGGGTLTVNNVGAAVTEVRLLAGLASDTAVFDRLIDNTTNELTISSRADLASTAVVAMTIADEETVNISGSSASNDLTIITMTADDLKTLNISGAADIVITNAITNGSNLATVNASTSTGAVTVNASNSVVALTATGGSGVFTFTGSILADSITGGAAADILLGGTGVDTINGGAGNDGITGGAGADVINVGSGTDNLRFGADGDTGTLTSLAGAISLTGVDVVTGMAAGDTIRLSGLGYTSAGSIANAVFVSAFSTSTLADNAGVVLRGSWIAGSTTGTGTFVGSASGADTLFVVDANEATGGQSYEAIVLVGTAGVTASALTDSSNVTVTLA